ncbi:hypothetical protein PFICI_12520 [Pestalotiopsis fici W106-1]|uniref:Glycosyl hydrolases family 2 sugar binding domain-containing protein n=1 Tax=Pestalotiopsis fici (strain W106-1 / CGMCC3.15140) TaxID=1229662 RepID=W3WRX5_PESFW|nr:uncharacterized protein PFICI_12520 [Pestalotiopsis fici W106-1]ETS75576.1 hypothetical protein PFICI_12520 [Pestalotiopsis fici W106-1]
MHPKLLSHWILPVLTGLVISVAAQGDGDDQTGSIDIPSLYESPRFRWWWPGGWIDADEVADEITAIVNAGFGGGEIADVQDSVKVDLDPAVYGWGQERWNAAVLKAYEKGNELGGHVDLTLGPHWPTGVPGYTPDSPETSKELVHGQLFLSAGQSYSGSLPLPVLAPSGNQSSNIVTATPVLEAVLVAKVLSNSTSGTVVVDSSTIQVLDTGADNTTVAYDAPDDGEYVLVAAYGRGTGQVQNLYDVTDPFPAYIVDHLSKAGVQASVDYWEQNLLTPELKAQLNESQGSMFEDSLELKLKQYWTLDFLAEFQTRRGYDLRPFLLYVLKDNNTFEGDASVSAQITNDFYQTVTDLYTEYRIGGITEWVNSLGLKFRAQPYTASFDSSYAASVLDIPEGESLGFDGDDDAFRVLATGRDIGGRTTILSDELGAYMGKAYGVTWKFILGTANHDMSLGVSQVVIHGFPYKDSPSSVWPGFAPFTPLGTSSNGFADAWGPRQPQWMFANSSSAYLARAQMLLQRSGPSIDVAILNQDAGVTASWDDTSLNDAGYSYQFPTAYLLKQHNVEVSNQRLASDGPAYKALIVNNATTMDVSTAELILSYGQSGLPLVIVESDPSSSFSYTNASGEEIASQLGTIFDSIREFSNTESVNSTSDVPGALVDLSVAPSVQYSSTQNASLITYRKTQDDGYLYWVYNDGDDATSAALSLEGSGAPYVIDLWSGSVSPIPAYSSTDNRVTVNVTVAATSAVVIYVGEDSVFNSRALSEHLIASSCGSHVSSAGQLVVTTNATCTATTSSNGTVTLEAEDLPTTVVPSSWSLTVQDWSPQYPNTTGVNSSATIKERLPTVSLTELIPWPNITSLEYASGVGVYNTTIDLTRPDNSTLVFLSVGEVEGTFGVSFNGEEIASIDQFGNKDIDITSLVLAGTNSLEITVATTLWNKLRQTWPEIYGSLDAQLIGLLGPVRIYYLQALVV